MKDLTKEIAWIKKNWKKIPDSFKINLHGEAGSYGYNGTPITNVSLEGHVVILLLNRQKPSVERSYDFHEERISVNAEGQVIWGFDSGCSCPSPWHDSYPGCYTCTNTWKEFVLNIEQFDHDALKEVEEKIEAIKKATP